MWKKVQSPSQSEAQQANLADVTTQSVCLTITKIPEVPKGSKTSPAQQRAPGEPPELPEESVQFLIQEALNPSPEHAEEEELSPVQHKAAAQTRGSHAEVGAPQSVPENKVPSPSRNKAQPSHWPSVTGKVMVLFP